MIKKDKKIELLTQGVEFKSKAEQERIAEQIEKDVADKLQLLFDGLELDEKVKFAGLEISFVNVPEHEKKVPKTGEIKKIPAKDTIKVKLAK